MNTRLCFGVFGLALSLLLVMGGCKKYSTAELYDPQYRTIAVPIFENRTTYREVEFQLTEAIVKELQERTPYTITRTSAADTVLQGVVVRVDQQLLSRRRPGNVPQTMEIRVWVDFAWRDLHAGEPIVSRQGFEAVGTYVPTSPLNEPIEVGLHSAVERLAEDIVSAMQADWGETPAP